MTDRLAAVGLRVLAPRATLLGAGNEDALQNVNTTELPDGSLCWAEDQVAFYVLHKSSAASPSGTVVVAPGSGPGRWIILGSGGADGSQVIVPDIAALAALPAPSDGEQAYVLTVRSGFVFETGSALTANGISVINATGGQWLRELAPDLSWAYQTNWYLNASTGNDQNVGDAAPTALATAAELTRRLNGQRLPQSVTVHQMTDLSEYIEVDLYVAEGFTFSWLGDPTAWTALYSGTLDAATALDTATNTPNDVTESAGGFDWNTSGPAGSSLIGKRLRLTSGAAGVNGATAGTLKRTSATVARTTTFLLFDPAAITTVLPPLVNPAGTETFVVEQLPKVKGLQLRNLWRNHFGAVSTALGVVPTIVIDSVDVGGLAANSTRSILRVEGVGVIVSRGLVHGSIYAGNDNASLVDCLAPAAFGSGANLSPAGTWSVIGGGCIGNLDLQRRGSLNMYRDFIVQTGRLFVIEPVTVAADGVAVFDSSQSGLQMLLFSQDDTNMFTLSVGARLWGSGNAQYGADIESFRFLTYADTKPTITGTSGDAIIGGQKITWAQAPYTDPYKLCGVQQLQTGDANSSGAMIYTTGIGAAIGAANLFTTTPLKGLYVVDVYLAVTTAGTAGDTCSVTIAWTDDAQAESVAVISAVSVAAKGFFTARQLVETTGAANVTYALAFPIKTGAPVVSLRVRVRQIESAGV